MGAADIAVQVLAAFPRVSMGRPYIEKLADVQVSPLLATDFPLFSLMLCAGSGRRAKHT